MAWPPQGHTTSNERKKAPEGPAARQTLHPPLPGTSTNKPQDKGPDSEKGSALSRARVRDRHYETLSGPQRQQRDLFIDGLLRGYSQAQAAIYAGVSPKSASCRGSLMAMEPYVRKRFAELREAMEEQELLTRKELLLNVKAIAFDGEGHTGHRVGASSLLVKFMGWQPTEKPQEDMAEVMKTLISKLPC